MAQTASPPEVTKETTGTQTDTSTPTDGSDFRTVLAAAERAYQEKQTQAKLDRRERALDAAIRSLSGSASAADRAVVIATARDFLDFLEGGA